VEILHGISVSPGIAIGKIHIIKQKIYQIGTLKIHPDQRQHELQKLDITLEAVLKKTDKFIEDYAHSPQDKEIFESQRMILLDPEVKLAIQNLINDELLTVEQAVSKHFSYLVKYFQNMKNEYFAQRANDFEDVSHNLLEQLVESDRAEKVVISPDAIIITKEITPSQVSIYANAKVSGICTEKGSHTSHSAILARAFGIPYIAAVPDLMDKCHDAASVVVDAQTGNIILDPNNEMLAQYKTQLHDLIAHQRLLQSIDKCDAITGTGKRIRLLANLEFPEEIDAIVKNQIDGIGLFRTEFLYLDRVILPSEDTQFDIYRTIIQKIGEHSLTIRTFDLGGDKLSHILNLDKEENPYLGCRGLRFSLQHRDIFRIQIRAILRAAVYGNIKIMFPMVIGAEDMHEGRQFVMECAAELEKEGKDFARNIKIGAMIEIPSAALCADTLADECDFFSIGTNDLVQYTLAVDRNNDRVAGYYQVYHPSVLSLIRMTVEKAHAKGLKVSVCGEMASEKPYINLLLALGVDELSCNSKQLLSVKDCILHFDEETRQKYSSITSSSTIQEIKSILNIV